MGQGYAALVGTPPGAHKLAWRRWFFNLRNGWLKYCKRTRARSFYFSQSGNDATGDGSAARPYRSLAMAQQVLDNSTGNINLYFKCGDTWRERYGLNVVKSNVRIDCYGTGAKPLFMPMTVTYDPGGWTNVSGDIWKRAATSRIGFLRECATDTLRLSALTAMGVRAAVTAATDASNFASTGSANKRLLHPNSTYDTFTLTFRTGANAGESQTITTYVGGTTKSFAMGSAFSNTPAVADVFLVYKTASLPARSWVWIPENGGELYLNPGAGVNPNGKCYEATDGGAWDVDGVFTVDNLFRGDGVRLAADGCYCGNIRCDGWGVNVGGTALQNYGFKSAVTGTDVCVFENCEAYFNGKHAPSALHNGAGGYVLFKDITAGYVDCSQSDQNLFNVYSETGNAEVIFDNCIARFGRMPDAMCQGQATTVWDGQFGDSTTYANSTNAYTPTFFGHCGSDSYQVALLIIHRCGASYENLPGATLSSGDFLYNAGGSNNSPQLVGDVTDPTTWRRYVVDCAVTHNQSMMGAFTSKTFVMNLRIVASMTGANNLAGWAQNGGTTGAVGYNIIWDLTHVSPSTARSIMVTGSTTATTKVQNAYIKTAGAPSAPGWTYSLTSGDGSAILANSIFHQASATALDHGLPNDANNIKTNAIYNLNSATNFSNGSTVTLSSAPSIGAQPAPGSQLYQAGTADPFGYGKLEYDFNWRRRADVDHPDIGPGGILGNTLPDSLKQRLAIELKSPAMANEIASRIASDTDLDGLHRSYLYLLLKDSDATDEVMDCINNHNILSDQTRDIVVGVLGTRFGPMLLDAIDPV